MDDAVEGLRAASFIQIMDRIENLGFLGSTIFFERRIKMTFTFIFL